MFPTNAFRAAPGAPARASRRSFLVGAAAAGGGLVLGFSMPGGSRIAALAQSAAPTSPYGAYLAIAPDGMVTVYSAHMEMGQGIYHGIATMVAEELGVDLAQVRVEGAAGNPQLYGNIAWGGAIQGTGGSTGTPSSWERYRRAGATAREMLRAAAAETWGVPLDTVQAVGGLLTTRNHAAGYGDMAAAAARRTPPTNVALKAPAQWTLIGRDEGERVGGRAKVTGQARYTIDVRLPGMLTAVVAHPPAFGARVASFDATAARRVPGVTDVVQISRGVAVVAENTWAAMRGREALTVQWDESKAERRSSAELRREYGALADRDGLVAVNRGDAGITPAGGRTIEATYEFPYLAHAALEPLNAVVRRQGDTLEVWGGHQMPDVYQGIAAHIAGLTPDRVRMHVMMTGGGFGRRAMIDGDVIAEAVETARAIQWRAPVKVQWTREDDMTGGRYRSAFLHKVRAVVGADGRIASWRQTAVGQSILIGTPFEAMLVRNGVDSTSVEGAADTPYMIPNLRVDVHNTTVGVPVLWWRSVGHTHTAYVVETMMDELAAAAGQDQVAFRLAHLPAAARERGVLTLAAERAGWGTAPARGRFRGVAVHQSFGSFVAMVMEISMEGATPRVHRVVAAVDCGVAVNPDVVRAQVQGGIGFGLGAIMAEEVTLGAGGRVEQTNYDTYTPLRIDAMPRVEVHIVPSTATPTGIGEPGVPPTGPALANAIAAATGRRVRTLPIAKGLA